MVIGHKRIGTTVAALWLTAALCAFSAVPYSTGCPTALDRGASISVRAPSSCVAGTQLCFEVTCYDTSFDAVAELNEISVTLSRSPGSDAGVTLICMKIPAGCGGSTVNITVVSSSGAVATASVTVI